MVCYTEHVTVKTERRYEIRDITDEVDRVREPGRLEARPENLGERFGDPGGPDPGEATSSGASASVDA